MMCDSLNEIEARTHNDNDICVKSKKLYQKAVTPVFTCITCKPVLRQYCLCVIEPMSFICFKNIGDIDRPIFSTNANMSIIFCQR